MQLIKLVFSTQNIIAQDDHTLYFDVGCNNNENVNDTLAFSPPGVVHVILREVGKSEESATKNIFTTFQSSCVKLASNFLQTR